jgi:hypothetical protein
MIDKICDQERKLERREAVTTKMGPNDASDVVWALGKSFSFLFRVLLSLTIILMHLSVVSSEIHDQERCGR